MRQPPRESSVSENGATRIIISSLDQHLHRTRTRRVYFAEDTVIPPVLAYVTHFPRLYVPLSGMQAMEVAQSGRSCTIHTKPGDVVFVPDNAWDKPEWSSSIQVLTFLFGAKQIGISLVEHKGGSETPVSVVKTHIHGARDGLTHNLLSALMTFAADRSTGPLSHLLTESLLHSCLRLLRNSPSHHSRKAARTYESICLYIQENFQHPLSRESVAEHFGLAPNHISRLFRHEGLMRFNDYLNLVRINRAKFMLRNYNMTLKEVAAKCGYSEVAYFCRLFKRIHNETPSQYRTSQNAGERTESTELAALHTWSEEARIEA
ncbi:MAG TPA: AraC family transcriptional regulator [Terriglobales bacterium]|nr:AraC family transcriptional regulator [Terriglobales bacterium]